MIMRVLCIVVSVALSACAAKPLTMNDLATLERGLSVTEVESILMRDPISRAMVDFQGQTYRSQMYPMQTGTRTDSMAVCTPGCVPIIVRKAVAIPYLVIYSGDGLESWGYVEELSKNVNSELVSLSAALMAAHRDDLERQEHEKELAKLEIRKKWHGF